MDDIKVKKLQEKTSQHAFVQVDKKEDTQRKIDKEARNPMPSQFP